VGAAFALGLLVRPGAGGGARTGQEPAAADRQPVSWQLEHLLPPDGGSSCEPAPGPTRRNAALLAAALGARRRPGRASLGLLLEQAVDERRLASPMGMGWCRRLCPARMLRWALGVQIGPLLADGATGAAANSLQICWEIVPARRAGRRSPGEPPALLGSAAIGFCDRSPPSAPGLLDPWCASRPGSPQRPRPCLILQPWLLGLAPPPPAWRPAAVVIRPPGPPRSQLLSSALYGFNGALEGAPDTGAVTAHQDTSSKFHSTSPAGLPG